MRQHILACLMLAAAVLAAGCTAQQSTSPGNATNNTTNRTTSTPATSTPGGTPATPTPGNQSGAPTSLTYVAKQSGPPGNNTTYKLNGPSSAAAGWVKITLRNEGLEPHQAVVLALGNMTYAQFQAALMAPPSNNSTAPELKPMGGVGASTPGGNVTAWVNLSVGQYAVVCFIPDPSGVPHAAHGMTAPLTVVASSAPAATPPVADVNVTLTDYNFTVSPNLTAGRHVLAIHNAGSHDHEAPIFKMKGNATLQDVLNAFFGGVEPPLADAGGGGPIEPGATEYVEWTFTPGTYGFACFEQDTPNAPFHAQLGMVLEVHVA